MRVERKENKGKKEKKEKKERERKEGKRRKKEIGKEKKLRERGRKGSRRSDGRNSLDQGVESGDSTRAYASRGRDSSYFGLLIAFGLLILKPCCAMLMAWDGFVASLKGLLSERIWVENCIYGSCQNAPATLGHATFVNWRNSVAPGGLQLQTIIFFSS